MIAFMRKMAVAQKHWIDPESFQSGVALCQTIPGATVMQMAAYIGLRVRGVRGALATYIGFCTPAFLLMMVLSALYVHTGSLPAVVSAVQRPPGDDCRHRRQRYALLWKDYPENLEECGHRRHCGRAFRGAGKSRFLSSCWPPSWGSSLPTSSLRRRRRRTR